jgi:hypothetical protein
MVDNLLKCYSDMHWMAFQGRKHNLDTIPLGILKPWH